MDTSQIKDWYISLFKDFENHLNGEKSSPFHKVRKEAIEKFAELEFPDLHQEDWRFTDVSPILSHNFNYPKKNALPSKSELSKFMTTIPLANFERMESHDVIFINGFYSRDISTFLPLPDGAIIGSLSDFMKRGDHEIWKYISKNLSFDSDIFTALNTAFAADGACIYIPENVVIERPIHIVFISQSEEKTISQPRNLIIAGKNSQAQIIEHYVGAPEHVYFTNAVTEFYLAENSNIEAVKIQSESMNAYHVATTEVFSSRTRISNRKLYRLDRIFIGIT